MFYESMPGVVFQSNPHEQEWGVCVCVCVFSCSVVSDFFQSHELQAARLLCPWNSPGKNTGVGCHFLCQKISSTQGLNPHLPYCMKSLYHHSHQGSPIDIISLMFVLRKY